MRTTRVTRVVAAPRSAVYRALLDADAVRQWMVPDGMTSVVHAFDATEGGEFRISLTYDDPAAAGKSAAATDTFHGRFARLVADTEVVQVVEFESDDPTMGTEMTITYRLADVDGGTEVVGIHENLPPGLSTEENETGWRMSLDKLAALVERATPAFSKVSHISFSARDKEASARWWSQVLGFQELDRVEGDGWSAVLLVHPATVTIIEFQQHDANRGERFDPVRTGFDHLGFKVDDRGALEAWQAHFERHGVDFTPIVDHHYGSVLTFRDPDGIQFEMFYREGHP